MFKVPKMVHTEPIKSLYVSNKLNNKFLRKLIFLHNNLMQYAGYSYREIIVRPEGTGLRQDGPLPAWESIVYYDPSIIIPPSANRNLRIYNILDKYLTDGKITKQDMEYANEVWRWLKDKAGIQDAVQESASQNMED